MKRCFSTLGCSELELGEILALCRRYGIGAAEIRGIGGELDNGKIPDFAPDRISLTRQAFADAGIAPLVLGSSCKFHDPEKTAQTYAREGRECVNIAAAVGFPYVRVFGNNTKPDPETAAKNVVEGIGELCAYAAERNVGILLEVHGDFNKEETLLPVTEWLAGCPNFGLIWDICHTDAVYGDSWEPFWDTFAPLIRHVHVKDRRRTDGKLVLPGEGDIPVRAIAARMTADGYDGCFSLEWERRWHPELAPMEEALAAFLRQTEGL